MNRRRSFICVSSVLCFCWSGLSRAQGFHMDFTKRDLVRDCWLVNDGVMGGISQSGLRHDELGMYFEGRVSLQNNGGFASMRSKAKFSQGTQQLELLAKGDAKRYKLILRTELAPRVTYESDFVAEPNWQTYRFKSSQFKSTFRGRTVDSPPLSFSDVIELGILIADNQEGGFVLQLKTIQSG